MTARSERVYFLKCDSCSAEHHDPSARSALEARVKAGVDGWVFVGGKPGRHGKGAVQQQDTCKDCAVQP